MPASEATRKAWSVGRFRRSPAMTPNATPTTAANRIE